MDNYDKSAENIKVFTGINPEKSVSDMTVVELYQLIKLAVNRKKEDS